MITIQQMVFIHIKSSAKLLQKEMLAKLPNIPIDGGRKKERSKYVLNKHKICADRRIKL